MSSYKAKTKRKDKKVITIAIIVIAVVILGAAITGIVFSVKPSKKQLAMFDTPSYWTDPDTCFKKGVSVSKSGNDYVVSAKTLTGLMTVATFNVTKDSQKQLAYSFEINDGQCYLIIVGKDTQQATIVANQTQLDATYDLQPGAYYVKIVGKDANFKLSCRLQDIPAEEEPPQE